MENIIFRKSWFKTLKRWEPVKVYEFILILERFLNEEDFEIPDNMQDFWDQVEPLLKSDKLKYQNVVERNKVNGKNGGRPPKNPKQSNITQENQVGYLETQTNPKNLKEKEIEKDKEKENEIDKEIEIDKEKQKNLFEHIPGFIESVSVTSEITEIDFVDRYLDDLLKTKMS